ncbi:hypothetical protein DF157_09665 [Burkholderia cenocepacia]|nr:hypothetical protein DF157_09665 [Burkholderia cenocepacia]RQV44865.1 hypothetical protein DF028_05845 [Burkholderia cenocepacia]RQV51532.1 hypothetical protein DF027_04350 [Burkholderia cenocepacia]RQV79417.1 hypothetical protein DF010_10140 [Burkholderia cenocepacia]
MTDRRYVFQRPAEAARLHARRRYAVRPALRAGRTRGHPACLPFAPRGPAAAAAARCAMPAQCPSSACHKAQRTQSHDTVQPFAFARRGYRGPSVPT